MTKKALIITYIGTSLKDNILKILNLKKNFEEIHCCDVFIAFTSKNILNKLYQKNIYIPYIESLIYKLNFKKYTDLIILPLHIICATEYERLIYIKHKYNNIFNNIELKNPLLYSQNSFNKFSMILNSIQVDKDIPLIAVAHGTSDVFSKSYYTLQNNKNLNKNIFITTIKGNPSFIELINKLQQRKLTKVYLFSLTLTLSYHSKNDIFDGNNSCYQMLLSKGFEVININKSLIDYKDVINMYIDNAKMK